MPDSVDVRTSLTLGREAVVAADPSFDCYPRRRRGATVSS
jgi:hypothetical protein